MDTPTRPSGACLLHRPPTDDTQAWVRADPGYVTCDGCLNRLRQTLREIATRYHQLDATPGASGEHGGRGRPGFGSRAPASEHIIVMTDWRSKSCEVSRDAPAYVWDPNADHDLHLDPGVHGPERPPGAYVEKRDVWYGADGRGHSEQANPPRSVPMALASLVSLIAEDRGISPTTSRDVAELVDWLDRQLDYVTRQEWVTDVANDLRGLAAQLRPVTGEPGRRQIGRCPNTLDEGETTRVCSAKLFAPLKGDTIRCLACSRPWHRPEWEKLGKMLQQRTLEARAS